MQVSVTQDYIQRGLMKNGYKCPIALKLKDQTGKEWFVTTHDAEVVDGKHSQKFPLPAEATQFARAFDAKGARGVHPITFELPYNPLRLDKSALPFEETL